MAVADTLTPYVLWWQDVSNVYLRINLRTLQSDPEIKAEGDNLSFSVVGNGMQGTHTYAFTVHLFRKLKENGLDMVVTEKEVNLKLEKKDKEWWDKITKEGKSPGWLKVDFDRWKDPDEDEEEVPDQETFERRQADAMVDQLTREFQTSSSNSVFGNKNFARTPYLLTYNLAMFFGYLIILIEMTFGYYSHGKEYYLEVWKDIAPKMKCCVAAQSFEIFHALLKMTRNDPKISLLQVAGRVFTLFFVISGEPRLQSLPLIFWLFCSYGAVEVFRYPYYVLATKKRKVRFMTWIRYTMWMPLFPMAIFMESAVILRSISMYEETGKYSIPLPNTLNLGLQFYAVEWVVLLFYPILGVILIRQMRQKRKDKLKLGRRVKTK